MSAIHFRDSALQDSDLFFQPQGADCIGEVAGLVAASVSLLLAELACDINVQVAEVVAVNAVYVVEEAPDVVSGEVVCFCVNVGKMAANAELQRRYMDAFEDSDNALQMMPAVFGSHEGHQNATSLEVNDFSYVHLRKPSYSLESLLLS